MRPIFQALAFAIAAGVAGVALAAPETGDNPLSRGTRDPFSARSFGGGGMPRSALIDDAAANPLARRNTPRASPVTPVPEPSQWAMMAAGLALVGYIVRRNRKK